MKSTELQAEGVPYEDQVREIVIHVSVVVLAYPLEPPSIYGVLAFISIWTAVAIQLRRKSPTVIVGGGFLAAIAVFTAILLCRPIVDSLTEVRAERLFAVALTSVAIAHLLRFGLIDMVLWLFAALTGFLEKNGKVSGAGKKLSVNQLFFPVALLGFYSFDHFGVVLVLTIAGSVSVIMLMIFLVRLLSEK